MHHSSWFDISLSSYAVEFDLATHAGNPAARRARVKRRQEISRSRAYDTHVIVIARESCQSQGFVHVIKATYSEASVTTEFIPYRTVTPPRATPVTESHRVLVGQAPWMVRARGFQLDDFRRVAPRFHTPQ